MDYLQSNTSTLADELLQVKSIEQLADEMLLTPPPPPEYTKGFSGESIQIPDPSKNEPRGFLYQFRIWLNMLPQNWAMKPFSFFRSFKSIHGLSPENFIKKKVYSENTEIMKANV